MAMTEREAIVDGPRWRERQPGPVPPAVITREGERALSEELARLRQELEVEFPDRLREALSFGEAHKNDDYLQIKEEEAVVASRARQLETLIHTARVVDQSRATDGRVSVGSTVELEDLASGRTSEHVLTGSYEQLATADISASSPIGQALLDRRAGEEVTVELPSTRTVNLKVRGVR
jgi:transcription elongation GreA/GreB family factor